MPPKILQYSAESFQEIKSVMLVAFTMFVFEFYVRTWIYNKSKLELAGTCIILVAKNSCIQSMGDRHGLND